MHYLKEATEIIDVISRLATAKTLWVDTEIAHWHTSQPKLSLIQVLAEHTDTTGTSAYILDVLDKHDLATDFINQIMLNSSIIKVFHNASFDIKYLGGQLAKNVICTLQIARKITRQRLQTSNLKLKTLAVELCHFSNVDIAEQSSDWGKRPLSQKQLEYAAMDTVYLAAVHRRLLEISNPNAVGNIFIENDELNQLSKEMENPSLSVTKVRVAFECPRLFYLNHQFGDKAIFLPKNTAIGIGNPFHHLADNFVKLAVIEPQFKNLFKPNPSQINLETITSQIQQIFYQIEFFPYLQAAIQKDASQAQALLQVWQGLQGLIKHFTELLLINRQYCNADTVISNTFLSTERSIENYFILPDGSKQRVRGEFDCLVFNFELNRLCVVEFKTYQPVDPSGQLAQVSLYSYMLYQKKKVAVDSAVYCVLPEFKEYRYSWEQLENTVHQLIPYKLLQMQQWLNWESPNPNPPPRTTQLHLCEICPQQQKCQTFFGEVISDPPQPPLKRGEKSIESEIRVKEQIPNADETGEALVNTLQSFGVGVDYLGAAVGPSFIRVKLKPNLGVKVSALLRLSNDLQVQLSLADKPLITPQAGYVSIDLPRPDRQAANFTEYIQQQPLPATAPVKIAIGINLEGKLVETDLSDPNTCHFLVGGTTGSGKSEFLRSLLLSLLYRYSPKNLKIALVDPKRVTFPEFERMAWLYSPVVKESDRATELMEELVLEMEFRYQQFEKASCADLTTYNQRSHQPLPRIVCIFDEYADFMAEKEIRKALEQSIKRLGAMARAAGIHLIIATQRPEASIVTPIIRSNLPGRVALRTASEADSKIVLGGTETSAAYLLGKGDLLYQLGPQLHRLQSLFAKTIQIPSI
ncbi:DNA translocase FtsK [Anabaena subtropica]|uniref:PD-(D/E)XK nuclease family protein n=1 Tax=Anabaena subtropica FACHB-260 TaxID=2692884 RepID=A0ABR8CSJ2_9NOST|nr:DNA translocase FtsK [Anabaena subtropica]MBD2345329.1 PD-(D/E)XK nuclease family protein [Anabaena subtropica FACHB-260]